MSNSFAASTAGFVGHVSNDAFQFLIGQISRTAFGRHCVETVQSVLEQGIKTLCNARRPIAFVFKFRRFGNDAVRRVTLNTDFVENLIALTLADWNTVAQFQLADWLDTGLSRSFGCFGNIAE